MHRKKICSLLLLLLLFVVSSPLSFPKKYKLAPGVTYRKIHNKQGPWSINILEVQLNESSLYLRTIKANNLISGNQQTSVMAKKLNHAEYMVVGGVNGDFYRTGGIPVGTQILKGKILKDPSNRTLFVLTDKMKPAIEIVSLNAWFICKNKETIHIDGINRLREANEVILYNSFRGPTTQTNKWGIEITLFPMNDFSISDTIRAVVKSVVFRQGNQPIPSEGMTISGHGNAALFLKQHISMQDTVALVISFPPISQPIQEAVGGFPRIIRNGHVSIEMQNRNVSTTFSANRHPRTAIGFDQDSTKLFLVAVDGRQPDHSVGMSLLELANFMLSLGCYQAINLDGGGSTTMLVGTQVVNRPSDATGERAVANAVVIISTAPEDSLAGLREFLSTLE